MNMNFQAMIQQAQRMKRDLEKAQEELKKKEFVSEKAGIVKVTMAGSYEIKSIEINEDAMDKDSKEMVEETIALAVNELVTKITAEKEAINSKITGNPMGM